MVSHYTSPFPGIAHWASLWVRPKPKEKERRKKEVTFIRSTWTEVNFVNVLVTILQKRYASWLERHLNFRFRPLRCRSMAPLTVTAHVRSPHMLCFDLYRRKPFVWQTRVLITCRFQEDFLSCWRTRIWHCRRQSEQHGTVGSSASLRHSASLQCHSQLVVDI